MHGVTDPRFASIQYPVVTLASRRRTNGRSVAPRTGFSEQKCADFLALHHGLQITVDMTLDTRARDGGSEVVVNHQGERRRESVAGEDGEDARKATDIKPRATQVVGHQQAAQIMLGGLLKKFSRHRAITVPLLGMRFDNVAPELISSLLNWVGVRCGRIHGDTNVQNSGVKRSTCAS